LVVRINTYNQERPQENDAKYIGLDVHQATISAAVQDAASELVMKTKAETICSSFAACAAVCM